MGPDRIVDVYAPYAVHGLERAMGLPPTTRLPLVTLILGSAGGRAQGVVRVLVHRGGLADQRRGQALGLAAPPSCPVTFEVMVLFAGDGDGGGASSSSRAPRFRGGGRNLPVEGVTDDRFALVLEETDAGFDKDAAERDVPPDSTSSRSSNASSRSRCNEHTDARIEPGRCSFSATAVACILFILNSGRDLSQPNRRVHAGHGGLAGGTSPSPRNRRVRQRHDAAASRPGGHGGAGSPARCGTTPGPEEPRCGPDAELANPVLTRTMPSPSGAAGRRDLRGVLPALPRRDRRRGDGPVSDAGISAAALAVHGRRPGPCPTARSSTSITHGQGNMPAHGAQIEPAAALGNHHPPARTAAPGRRARGRRGSRPRRPPRRRPSKPRKKRKDHERRTRGRSELAAPHPNVSSSNSASWLRR